MQSSLERYCRHSLSLLWQFPWWWMILSANIGWIFDGSSNDAHYCVKRLMLMIFQKWAIRARIGTLKVRRAQEALNLCHRQPLTSLFITSCDSISMDIRTSSSIGHSHHSKARIDFNTSTLPLPLGKVSQKSDVFLFYHYSSFSNQDNRVDICWIFFLAA